MWSPARRSRCQVTRLGTFTDQQSSGTNPQPNFLPVGRLQSYSAPLLGPRHKCISPLPSRSKGQGPPPPFRGHPASHQGVKPQTLFSMPLAIHILRQGRRPKLATRPVKALQYITHVVSGMHSCPRLLALAADHALVAHPTDKQLLRSRGAHDSQLTHACTAASGGQSRVGAGRSALRARHPVLGTQRLPA